MPRALQTDLYQLTMAAAYLKAGRNPLVSFELFVRRLPAGRGFLVAAGLQQALQYLRGLRFTPEEIDYLRSVPQLAHLPDDYFSALAELRFTGEVWAVAEGTLVFPGEPLLRVTAPLVEAQLVETYLLATMHLQTLVASKAARVVLAAGDKPVYDFGTRRAHGPQAGLWAARAAYLAGCAGTSNCEAGMLFGIPLAGTMAHSFVMAWGDERRAFAAYRDCFPGSTALLVDTYDTLQGVARAVELQSPPAAIRLDSGNLLQLSRRSRELLDGAGRQQVKIIVSGNLNEQRIAKLLADRAPVDAFGVGTELVVSADAPALDIVYKLCQVDESAGSRLTAKASRDKATLGGRKQVWRVRDRRGRLLRDVIGLEDERLAGTPLLRPVLRQGRLLDPETDLERARARVAEQLGSLPPRYRRLRRPECFPVKLSKRLQALSGRRLGH